MSTPEARTVSYWMAYGYICLACGMGASWVLNTTDQNWAVYAAYIFSCVICMGILDGGKE
jgi:hypothetical protein